MRLTALALVALLAAACGDDEPDEMQTPQPTPQQPAVDTMAADTMARTGTAEQDGQRPGQRARGEQAEPGADADADGDARTTGAAAGQRLYTVQVAAFTEASSAQEWEGRLRQQGLPVWTSMAELGGRTFYRLRVGAVPSVSEARQLGTMLTERYEWPVWVAPIGPADRFPSNAVESTRRVLEGS